MITPNDGLRRELSLFDAVMINVGSMIGSGIFLVPAAVALALPDLDWIVAVWVAGGLASLAGALTVAELGAVYPRAGGLYAYLTETVSPLAGFLYGWSSFTIINSGSIAAVAVGSASYLSRFVPLSASGIKIAAVASILILTLVHVFGVRTGARVQNWFTVIKVGLVLLFAGLGFALSGDTAGLQPATMPSLSFPSVVVPFGAALIAVLWAYDGWIEATMVGSELRDPAHALPLSLVTATGVMIVLYVLITLAYHAVLPMDDIRGSAMVASDAAERLWGAAGAGAVAAAVVFSTTGTNNGFVFTVARIYFAMARAGLFFRSFGRVHPRFGTPVHALAGQAAWSSVLVLTGTFEQLTSYVVFASWLFYGLAGIGVVRRRRSGAPPSPFRVPFYPVLPAVFLGCCLYVAVSAVLDSPSEAALGIGLILSGIPAYHYWRRSNAPTGPQPFA